MLLRPVPSIMKIAVLMLEHLGWVYAELLCDAEHVGCRSWLIMLLGS